MSNFLYNWQEFSCLKKGITTSCQKIIKYVLKTFNNPGNVSSY